MKTFLIFICLAGIFNIAEAQTYISNKSLVSFFSSAPLEDITAKNDKARSVFDSDKGEIAFTVPIKEFVFRKGLMKEHFNEKYMESEKFPKSTFTGKVSGFSKGIDNAQVWAEGTLEIHGVKKNVKIPGQLNFTGDNVHVECKFIVKLEDYDIEIPSLLFQNIAEEIEVSLSFDYKVYEN